MKAIIAWFARNGVAANLLAAFIIVAGLLSIQNLKREIFPEVDSEMISISVPYLGAAPAEVEEGVCVRIEEAIQGLDGIKQLKSTATEGMGTVTVEIHPGEDVNRLLSDIKTQVDAIDTFPELTEKPIVKEIVVTKQVINIAIAGRAEEKTLKQIGERMRDELAALPNITQVRLGNARPYEISIELSEEALRAYRLSFDQVADAIRRRSLDLPGGSVRTRGGEILLRTKGQAYIGTDFEEIVVITRRDGTRVTVGDVATVVDGFAETDQSATFDGMNSVLVQVFRVGAENALAISATVEAYVKEARTRLPEGLEIATWQDDSSYLRGRQDLLLKNGAIGLILVFFTLALFLRFKLALWVSFGLVVSFLGTFWLMPFFGISINLLSLFAFILVLGIVVDDAIVVSENIHTHQENYEGGLIGSIKGAQDVAKPVTFAVLTTAAAFLPLSLVPGATGKIMKVIPLIVIPTVLFSLIESLFILPNHLSHHSAPPPTKVANPLSRLWSSLHRWFSEGIKSFIARVYRPALATALQWRYATIAAAVALLFFTIGMVGGDRIKFVFFPPVEGDNVAAILTMPLGTPAAVTAEAVRQLEEAAFKIRAELDDDTPEGGQSSFRHVLASVGQQPYLAAQQQGAGKVIQSIASPHLGEVHIELAPSEQRTGMTSQEIAARWREVAGPVPGAVELNFTASIFSTGEPVDIQLTGPDFQVLEQAANDLKQALAGYDGVTEITDTFRAGKKEIKLNIKPEAETLGLSLQDLGRQVRQAFYGEEVQRIQRGRDEVKVMARFPVQDRQSPGSMETMRIRTRNGDEVPFSVVAEAKMGRGYANITRTDRRRAVNVRADVDTSKTSGNKVIASLTKESLPKLLEKYPGLQYTLEGEQQEQQETMAGIAKGYPLALIIIYALLAIPFRSYSQPFIVMSAIPFGIVGAIWGHAIMGMELTILSMFGIVALSGVVVNDNLVLVDYINRHRAKGMALTDAVREAGAARFRPILLTSVTTFMGLMPLILEKSVQARFLIPMAISLAFGVMFATLISLFLVPSGYIVLEDLKQVFGKSKAGGD